MDDPLTRVKFAVAGVVSIVVVAVFMLAGLADGGPWGPFEAAAVAITVVAVILFKVTDAHLSTRQDGIALGLLLLLCLLLIAVDAVVNGEQVSSGLLAKFGIGFVVAAAFVGWSFVSRRSA